MTQEEFLLDTLEYYSVDPVNRRCVDASGRCTYSPSTIGKAGLSEGCAIGRHLDEKFAIWADMRKRTLSASNLIVFHSESLPKWMREFDKVFVDSVQYLHDTKEHWTEKGLSVEGKNELDIIIITYALNRDLFTKYLN